VIPLRSNRRCPRAFDTSRYRARHGIGNLFARLKHVRRLAARYDKLATHFAAVVTLASICWGWLNVNTA
jgi:putative transposase